MKKITLLSSSLLLICLCLLLCQGTPVSKQRVRRQEFEHNDGEQLELTTARNNDDDGGAEVSLSIPTSVENDETEATTSAYTSDNETATNEQNLLTNCVCFLLPTPKTQSREVSLKEQSMTVRIMLSRTKEPYDQRNVTINVPQDTDIIETTSESRNETEGGEPTTNLEENVEESSTSTNTLIVEQQSVADVQSDVLKADVAPNSDGDWQRVFEDDFNQDGAIDGNKWQFDVGVGPNGDGWGNNELQYYTDNRLENAHCQDGQLVIEALKEAFESREYTSAKLKSKQTFLYGRLQIRAKLPTGKGSWSALWMLPETKNYGSKYWPDNGEIDLMEQVGFDPLKIVSTVHTQANNHQNNNQPTASVDVSDATTQYKIYTLQWNSDKIEMFVGADEATALQTSIFSWEKGDKDWTQWPFDKPFYIIMNIAVGGNWGGKEGIDESTFPQQMTIDWVHFDRKK